MIRPFWPSLSKLIAAVNLSQKRTETYNGTTAGSGEFSVVYAQAYPVAPHVEPQIIPQTDPNQQINVIASSTTGFTVRVVARGQISVLGVGLALGFNVSNVNGANVSVLVRQR